MYELIPIFAGIAAGLAAMALDGRRARIALVVAVAVIAGVTASVLSGEIEESWAFVLWDTAQALVAGALTVVAATALANRRAGARRGG
jgi:undecaprenyl pyrophosphate phosphatase UppP